MADPCQPPQRRLVTMASDGGVDPGREHGDDLVAKVVGSAVRQGAIGVVLEGDLAVRFRHRNPP